MSTKSAGFFLRAFQSNRKRTGMLTNADIKEIRKLTDRSKARHEAGLFVIEGAKIFSETPLEWIERVYVTKEFLDDLDRQMSKGDDASLRASEIIKWMQYDIITSSQMEKISDTKTPQGILCVLRQPGYVLDDILKLKGSRPGRSLIMVLEDIQDPGNLGTVMRSAEGAGAIGVIMSRGCVDIFNPKTIRSTMGSVFRVPFCIEDDLKHTVQILKDNGFGVYAAHLKGKRLYSDVSYTDTAFLIGNEGNGLSDGLAECADEYIRIPMEGKLESLNASVAASILMYEHYRKTSI